MGNDINTEKSLTTADASTNIEYPNVLDIAYGNNKYIAVCYKMIIESDDGVTWTIARDDSDTENTYSSIKFISDRFFIFGNVDGKIGLTTTNGLMFIPLNIGFIDGINSCAYNSSNGKYVLVGNNEFIYYSDDAISWTKATDLPNIDSVTSIDILDVIWDNTGFIAVTNTKNIIESMDGNTWTIIEHDIPTNYDIFKIGYNPEIATYIVLLQESEDVFHTYISSNKINWEYRLSYTGEEASKIYDINDLNDTCCKVSINVDLDSPHLYINVTNDPTEELIESDVIVCSQYGTLNKDEETELYTFSPINVSSLMVYEELNITPKNPSLNKGETVQFSSGVSENVIWIIRENFVKENMKKTTSMSFINSVAYGNNKYVAVGRGIYTSVDGEIWSQLDTNGVIYNLDKVIFDNDKFIIVGLNTIILYNSDDSFNIINSLSSDSIQTLGHLHSITKYENSYVAIGDRGLIIESTDNGLTWNDFAYTLPDNAKTLSLRSIVYVNNSLFIVGEAGNILSFTNSQWENKLSPTTRILRDIAFDSLNRLIAVGDYGTIVYSLDGGLNWGTLSENITNDNIVSIIHDNNKFVILTTTGDVFDSIDGKTWFVSIKNLTNYAMRGISYTNNKIIATGYNSIYEAKTVASTSTISEDGLLTIAEDEPNTSLTIIVKLASDENIFDFTTTIILNPNIIGITVTPSVVDVKYRYSQQFTATVEVVDEAPDDVYWTIENANSTSTISEDGLLTIAEDEPNTSLTIRATSQFDESKYADATVSVIALEPSITSVSIEPESISMAVGGQVQFTATVLAVDFAPETVTWSIETSGTEPIQSTIDNNGLLTIHAEESINTLIVKATSTFDDTKYDTSTVNVLHPAITSVSVIPSEVTIEAGFTQNFTAEVIAVDQAPETVIWNIVTPNTSSSIDSSGILSVDIDEVNTALVVRATSTFDSSKYGEATIIVTPALPRVHSVTITPDQLTMLAGLTYEFNVRVVATAGAPDTVTWEVSKPIDSEIELSNETYIDENGILHVFREEPNSSLIVKVISTFDPTKYDELNVLLEYGQITSIEIIPEEYGVVIGNTIQFNVNIQASDSRIPLDVIWSVYTDSSLSIPATISSIDNTGLLTVPVNETQDYIYIKVESVFDPTKYAMSTIDILIPAVLSVTISPKTAMMDNGFIQQFEANVVALHGASEEVSWEISNDIATANIIENPTDNLLTDIRFLNGEWFAIGESGIILNSVDGLIWYTITQTEETGTLCQISYGNGRFIIVGKNKSILTSLSGETWTKLIYEPFEEGGYDINHVIFGNGRFVICTSNNTIAVSTNGLVWNVIGQSITIENITRLEFVNGEFIISTENGGIMVSSDGETWSEFLEPGLLTNEEIYSVAYGNGKYIAIGNNIILEYQFDEAEWTINNSIITEHSFNQIIFCQDRFIIISNNAFLHSLDGETWEVEIPNELNKFNRLDNFGYDRNNKFIGIGSYSIDLNDHTDIVEMTKLTSVLSTITDDGLLTIDSKEENSQLKITAISVFDPTKYDTADVTIEDMEIENLVLVPSSITLIQGTQCQFSAKATTVGSGKVIDVMVKWSIVESNKISNTTSITEEGLLTIGQNELIPSLTVKAVYTDEVSGKEIVVTANVIVEEYLDDIVEIIDNATTNETLNGIVYKNNKYIVVGNNGTIMNSSNGINWSLIIHNITTEHLNGITYGNNKYITIGNGGMILTSSDGIMWDYINLGEITTSLNGITYGNNKYITIGNGGMILTSSDGNIWTEIEHGLSTTNFVDINYHSGKFIVIGGDESSGVMLTSVDGQNWETASIPSASKFTTITYADDKYIVFDELNNVFISTDQGNTWIVNRNVININPAYIKSVTFGNETFVATATNGTIYSSKNGIKWEEVEQYAVNSSLNDIVYGTDKFIAVGDNGNIVKVILMPTYSEEFEDEVIIEDTNGTLDTENINGATKDDTDDTILVVGDNGFIADFENNEVWNIFESGTDKDLYDVICDDGLYITVGEDIILVSNDKETWTNKWKDEYGNSNLTDITSAEDEDGNTIYIAVGDKGEIFYSTDNGETWTKDFTNENNIGINVITSETPEDEDYKYICGGDNGFIAVSSDLDEWIEIPSTITENINDIIYDGNKYIIVTDDGGIYISEDLTEFTKLPSGTLDNLNDVNYIAPDNYIIIGDNGTLLVSNDGKVWENRDSETDNNLNTSIVEDEDTYIIFGDNGTVITYTPSKIRPISDDLTNPIYFFNNRYDDLVVGRCMFDNVDKLYCRALNTQELVQNAQIVFGKVSDFSVDENMNIKYSLPSGTYTYILKKDIIPYYNKKIYIDKYHYDTPLTLDDIFMDHKTFSRRMIFRIDKWTFMELKLISTSQGNTILCLIPNINSGLLSETVEREINKESIWTITFDNRSDMYYTYLSKNALFSNNRIPLSVFTKKKIYNKPDKINSWSIYISSDGQNINLLSHSSAKMVYVENSELFFEVDPAFYNYIIKNATNCKCYVFNEYKKQGSLIYNGTEETYPIFQIPYLENPVAIQNAYIYEYDAENKVKLQRIDPNGYIHYPNIFDFSNMGKGHSFIIEWYESSLTKTKFDNNIKEYMNYMGTEYASAIINNNAHPEVLFYRPIKEFLYDYSDYINHIAYKNIRKYKIMKLRELLFDNSMRYQYYIQKMNDKHRKYITFSTIVGETDILLQRNLTDNRQFVENEDDIYFFNTPHTYVEFSSSIAYDKNAQVFINGKRVIPTLVSTYNNKAFVYLPLDILDENTELVIDMDITATMANNKVTSSFILTNTGIELPFPEPDKFKLISSKDLIFFNAETKEYISNDNIEFKMNVPSKYITHLYGEDEMFDALEKQELLLTNNAEFFMTNMNEPVELAADYTTIQAPEDGFYKKVFADDITISTSSVSNINTNIGVSNTNNYRWARIPDVTKDNDVYMGNFRENPSAKRFRAYQGGVLMDSAMYEYTPPTTYGGNALFTFNSITPGTGDDNEIIIEYLAYEEDMIFSGSVDSDNYYNGLIDLSDYTKEPLDLRYTKIFVNGLRVLQEKIHGVYGIDMIYIEGFDVSTDNLVVITMANDKEVLDYENLKKQKILNKIAKDDSEFATYLISTK